METGNIKGGRAGQQQLAGSPQGKRAMPQLVVKAIEKRFNGQPAVAGVSLEAAAGDIVCLLGPSGCGKTTLLRLVAGLETPDAGGVWFEGRDLAGVPPHQRRFGLMFQEFALFPHLSVAQNVAFGLKMQGETASAQEARTAQMLQLVDLADYAGRRVDQLSGGEQQRVALARALAPQPRLLMLDEPLGALDRALRERLMVEVRAILKQVGVTALYVTHDQTEALAIADRVAIMHQGRLEQVGAPQAVYRRPATPFVARFLGLHNVVAGVAAGDVAHTAIGPLPLPHPHPSGTPVLLLLRPEALNRAEGWPVTGRITHLSFRGRYTQIGLEVQGERLIFETPAGEGWPLDQATTFYLALNHICLLSA